MIREYVVLSSFGSNKMQRAVQAALDELEGDVSWVEEDGTKVTPSVTIRAPRRSEAEGTYALRDNSPPLLLGYTNEYPDALRNLIRAAWEKATR